MASAGVPSTAHSRSAICSQKIGLRSVSDCAAALRSLEGATTVTLPILASPCASARRPGAKIPSSFVTKMFGMKSEANYKSTSDQPEGFATRCALTEKENGRDDWIRTSDLTHPKRARYQAAPRPDRGRSPRRQIPKRIGRPTGSKNSVSPRFEEGQDGKKLFAKIEQVFALRAGKFMVALTSGRRRGSRFNARLGDSALLGQMAARSGDCEAFVVEQALDFEDGFDVFAAVHAVAAGALHGLQRGEFGLPVTQDERFGGGQSADFADAEKAFVRYGRCRRCG